MLNLCYASLNAKLQEILIRSNTIYQLSQIHDRYIVLLAILNFVPITNIWYGDLASIGHLTASLMRVDDQKREQKVLTPTDGEGLAPTTWEAPTKVIQSPMLRSLFTI